MSTHSITLAWQNLLRAALEQPHPSDDLKKAIERVVRVRSDYAHRRAIVRYRTAKKEHDF